MPIVVACPTCNGQLRVADDLIGRKVRCPTCQAIFDAIETSTPTAPPEPPRPAPPSGPVETVPVNPWQSLNLELSDPTPAEKPAPVGAVEIKMTLDDDQPRPGDQSPDAGMRACPGCGRSLHPDSTRCYGCGYRFMQEAPEREPEPRRREDAPAPRRAKLADDHDDLRECSRCGRQIHRDSNRCLGCGLRFGNDDDRPRRSDDFPRRPARRDSEPDRGGTVMALGIISLVVMLTGCLAPLGLILGVCAWWMGAVDLAKMRRGDMSPEGHSNTQAGYICGIIGTCLNGLIFMCCGVGIAVPAFEDYQRNQRQQRQRAPFQAPPKR